MIEKSNTKPESGPSPERGPAQLESDNDETTKGGKGAAASLEGQHMPAGEREIAQESRMEPVNPALDLEPLPSRQPDVNKLKEN